MDPLPNHNLPTADPWAELIVHRLHWSPLQYGFAIFVANVVIDFSGAWLFGAFITQSGPPGLLQDTTFLLVAFLMMPAIGGFYIWTTTSMIPLLQELEMSGVFSDRVWFQDTMQRLTARSHNKAILILSLGVSFILTLMLLGTFLAWYPWARGIGYPNVSPILPWLSTPRWFLTAYALSFGLCNISLTVVTLHQLFSHQPIRISPWHPDKCGGLKGISNYSVTLGYPIAAVGLTMSVLTIREIQAGSFSAALPTWAGIVAYLVFAPLVFFLPLSTAHTALREAKHKELMCIAQQFDKEYALTKDTAEVSVLETRVKKIEQLRKLYEIADNAPVWPFDTVNLRRFIAITGGPIVPSLASVALSAIRSFFGV